MTNYVKAVHHKLCQNSSSHSQYVKQFITSYLKTVHHTHKKVKMAYDKFCQKLEYRPLSDPRLV